MQSINDIVRASKLKSGYNARLHADVAKLVDAPDLGSGAARRVGSIPIIRTKAPEIQGLFLLLSTYITIF